MHITKMTLRNFGPFYGTQDIALGAGERPVTLIFGENMRGKTSLMNALRWALYGQARSRTGAPLSLAKLLNTDAAREDDKSFSVDVEIEDGDAHYQVTRQAQSGSDSSRDESFEVSLHVRKDGAFLSAEEADVSINRLLPEGIAHFFLFDGEMLNDFEELISDASSQAETIKGSIEQILGLPALENSINDLQALWAESQKRRTKTAQSVTAARKDAENAEKIDAELEVKSRDLEDLQNQLGATKTEAAELENQLRAYEGIQSDMATLQEMRERKAEADTRHDELSGERRELLAGTWNDVLESAVGSRLRLMEDEKESLQQAASRAAEEQAMRRLLEQSLEDPCPVCGAGLGEGQKTEVQRRLASLPIAEVSDLEERQEAVAVSLARLRRASSSGNTAKVALREGEMRRMVVESTKAQNRITELETKLRDHDSADISRKQKEKDRLLRHEGVIESQIKSAEDEIALLSAKADQLRQRIGQVSDPQIDRLNREVEIYQGLLSVFKAGLAELRDELKVVIERDASEIFRRLTTDPSYSGLRINDFYGLYILDGAMEEVPVRSAGAEQVVALSLIGALNRNAVKRGPVMMDTPFGRLDKRHRANILEFLATMTDQVVLLVHSGEVDRERDLQVVEPHVQRQYDLEYVTSSRTRIAPMEGRATG